MSCQSTHSSHEHTHSAGCGHTAIKHGDHIDYVHDGHLHNLHGDHIDEHVFEVSDINPVDCKPVSCGHTHADLCGHESLPHGDHIDFIIDGRLHYPHQGHCDDHGQINLK